MFIPFVPLILPAAAHRRVLLFCSDGDWRLPYVDWKQLGSGPLLPWTAAEWSIRDRQHWLAERVRALVRCGLGT